MEKDKKSTAAPGAEQDNIFKRIARARDKIAPLLKKKPDAGNNPAYRGLDGVIEAALPVLKKCGIFTVPEALEISREKLAAHGGGALMHSVIKMRYTFYGEDGTNIAASVVGEAMDAGDKSSAKAQATAYRAALCQIFCIPTGGGVSDFDKDAYRLETDLSPAPPEPAPQPNAAGPSPPGGQQQSGGRRVSNWTRLKEIIKGTAIKMDGVVELSKERYGTERLNSLTPEQLADFAAALKEKAAKSAARR
ncbi:MAG: ERF family protein [Clostridiales bacterium]|jgi:hypothetical protein|nr:ERF family protein [Clostridiales bacterium]